MTPPPKASFPGDVVVGVLAGGLGTRLQSTVPDLPKVLAPINGRPFLDLLLDWLAQQGVRTVVLMLGHRSGQVTDHLAGAPRADIRVETVTEPRPLGTGGAIGFARRSLGDHAIVLNGDTFVDVDLAAFAGAAMAFPGPAGVVAVQMADTTRFGRMDIMNDRILSFREKVPGSPGWINGGVYFLKSAALDHLAAQGAGSIETDYFQVLPPGNLMAWKTQGRFIDIGTAESFAMAPSVIGLNR